MLVFGLRKEFSVRLGNPVVKPDERELMTLVAESHGGPYNPNNGSLLDDLAGQMGMHPKRAIGIAEKWERRGWWDSGVSTRAGWLTPAGYAEASWNKPGICE